MKLIIIVLIILIIRSKWKSPTTVQGLELTQEETHPFDLSIPFRFDKYQHCHHHPHKEHQHHHHRSQTENANIYQVDKAVVPRKIWTLSEYEFLIKSWLQKKCENISGWWSSSAKTVAEEQQSGRNSQFTLHWMIIYEYHIKSAYLSRSIVHYIYRKITYYAHHCSSWR